MSESDRAISLAFTWAQSLHSAARIELEGMEGPQLIIIILVPPSAVSAVQRQLDRRHPLPVTLAHYRVDIKSSPE